MTNGKPSCEAVRLYAVSQIQVFWWGKLMTRRPWVSLPLLWQTLDHMLTFLLQVSTAGKHEEANLCVSTWEDALNRWLSGRRDRKQCIFPVPDTRTVTGYRDGNTTPCTTALLLPRLLSDRRPAHRDTGTRAELVPEDMRNVFLWQELWPEPHFSGAVVRVNPRFLSLRARPEPQILLPI